MRALIELLSDGEFHSGEQLGAVLGVSRAAVWKRLQQVEERYGLAFDRVQGKGYRLASALSLLDPAAVAAMLGGHGYYFETIDSTNAEALRCLASEGCSEMQLFVAEQQTAGRGRRGRAWHSPYAENLYFSLLLPVEDPTILDGLSLLVGLSIQRSLKQAGFLGVGLKWPNDVLAGGVKVAGVLLELVGDPSDRCHVVIGVGLNVNMLHDCGDIDQRWTSLRKLSGGLVDRAALLAVLVQGLSGMLAEIGGSGFASFRAEWERAHAWQGKAVRLVAGVQQITGIVLGVDDRGALRLQRDDGVGIYSGGEISLRLSDDS